ncbi:MAG: hypothetical protein DWQ37_02755 [Planctomycetota bacterium]|nr:MAG: hypothetical protein DWQ37_02755 [Planctomycetota bacterium]
MKWRLSTEVAAGVAGAAIYLPIGLRGTLFALCPALAGGRRRLWVIAPVAGFVLECVYQLAWLCLPLVWEPRGEFNEALALYLPPIHKIVTHHGCTVPNSVQFVAGLVGWTGCYFVLWMLLWPRPLPWRARFAVPVVGMLLVALAGAGLWRIAPLDEWHGRFAFAAEKVPQSVFALAVVLSMPVCTFVLGLLIHVFERRTTRADNLPPPPPETGIPS